MKVERKVSLVLSIEATELILESLQAERLRATLASQKVFGEQARAMAARRVENITEAIRTVKTMKQLTAGPTPVRKKRLGSDANRRPSRLLAYATPAAQ